MPADLDADLGAALALAPEHLSYYELEAKPGTRFTHGWGDELTLQADAMEGYFEQVVETLVAAGYRWYETANFCVTGEAAAGRDLRAHHNLGIWHARDYLGLGIGAVSTVDGTRWRNKPGLPAYLGGAPSAGSARPASSSRSTTRRGRKERLMLGLRLDEPLSLDDSLERALDEPALARLFRGGLVEVGGASGAPRVIRLTDRGRPLGGGITAELLRRLTPADDESRVERPSLRSRNRWS